MTMQAVFNGSAIAVSEETEIVQVSSRKSAE